LYRDYVCPSVCDVVLAPGNTDVSHVGNKICVAVQILNRIDQLWAPPSLLANAYRRLFLHGKNGRGMNLTAHLHLVPRSVIVEQYLHSPIPLHGVMTD
jgi:hypothetical protein